MWQVRYVRNPLRRDRRVRLLSAEALEERALLTGATATHHEMWTQAVPYTHVAIRIEPTPAPVQQDSTTDAQSKLIVQVPDVAVQQTRMLHIAAAVAADSGVHDAEDEEDPIYDAANDAAVAVAVADLNQQQQSYINDLIIYKLDVISWQNDVIILVGEKTNFNVNLNGLKADLRDFNAANGSRFSLSQENTLNPVTGKYEPSIKLTVDINVYRLLAPEVRREFARLQARFDGLKIENDRLNQQRNFLDTRQSSLKDRDDALKARKQRLIQQDQADLNLPDSEDDPELLAFTLEDPPDPTATGLDDPIIDPATLA